jgi:two-component system, cell cycle response regulator DivK
MPRILLIEDDADTRELVRLTLELHGHEVEEAATGEEGIERALAIPPDLVLMDLSLAGRIDGLEATRRLRAERTLDRTQIVALTAHAMPSDRERALAAGCDDYWTKPILDLDAFQSAVTRAAGGRGALPVPGC